MRRLRLYDYPASGNCFKVRLLLAQLRLCYDRAKVDIFGGDTLEDRSRETNRARRVPVLQVDNSYLDESNRPEYLPQHSFERAQVLAALLFEQEQIAQIATLRSRLRVGLLKEGEPEERRLRHVASNALGPLDAELQNSSFITRNNSIADISADAYVHVAPDAGLDLDAHHAVRPWIGKVEAQPRFAIDLEALPNHPLGRGLSING